MMSKIQRATKPCVPAATGTLALGVMLAAAEPVPSSGCYGKIYYGKMCSIDPPAALPFTDPDCPQLMITNDAYYWFDDCSDIVPTPFFCYESFINIISTCRIEWYGKDTNGDCVSLGTSYKSASSKWVGLSQCGGIAHE